MNEVTQEECLLSPHHATYLGVCYEGTDFVIGISSPQNPQPVTFTPVYEPSPLALWPLALLAFVIVVIRKRYV